MQYPSAPAFSAPSVFLRDPEDMRFFTRKANKEAAWVLEGSGIPQRVRDGRQCMLTIESGACTKLERFRSHRPMTSLRGVFVDYYDVVRRDNEYTRPLWAAVDATDFSEWPDGVYPATLVGPDINGGYESQAAAVYAYESAPDVLFGARLSTYEEILAYLAANPHLYGILWKHVEGDQWAQVLRSDFGLVWPPEETEGEAAEKQEEVVS